MKTTYVFVALSGKMIVYNGSELPRYINQLFYSPDSQNFYGLIPLDYVGDEYKHSLVFSNPHSIDIDVTLECDEVVITHGGEEYHLDTTLVFDRTNQKLIRTTTNEESTILIIKAKR